MLSVATLVMAISALGWVEGLNGCRRTNDELVLFGAVLTLFLSSILFIVGLLWWLGWLSADPAPLLLPTWQQMMSGGVR
jgi:hypothetical protein